MKIFARVLWLCLAGFAGGAAAAAPAGDAVVEEIETPAPPNSQQHHLAGTADGRLILSWVEVGGGKSTARFAIRHGGRWSAPRTVVSVVGKLADPPVVLGLSDGALAAAWMFYLPGSADRYAAEIRLARSSDSGLNWSKPVKPYGDQARIYDAQMSLAALPGGELALVWTDKRHVPVPTAAGQPAEPGCFQLMATVLDAGLKPGTEITLDPDVCSCCRSVTAADGRDLLTVYRDHRGGEVRDIGTVRWNGGADVRPASVPPDGWVLNGCPSNGPSVALRDKRAIAAWFTAAGGVGRVRAAFSDHSGAGFGKAIDVDTDAVGYANTVLLDDGSALVSWRGRSGADEELRLARVTPQGDVGEQSTVYRGGFPNWPSKYPGMERIGDEVFLAWTDPLRKRVRLAKVVITDWANY